MRMPISRVRSVTLTSMMFMMPMPPTSRETLAMAASKAVITSVVARHGLGDFLLVAQDEVVIGAGLDAVALAQQIADAVLDLGNLLGRLPPAR